MVGFSLGFGVMVAVRFGFGVSAVVAVGVRFWDAMRRRQRNVLAPSWSGRLGSAMSWSGLRAYSESQMNERMYSRTRGRVSSVSGRRSETNQRFKSWSGVMR